MWDYALAWRSLVLGDIDGDGQVNVGDIVLMQQAVAGELELSQPQHSRADVYPAGGDGKLSISDLVGVQRITMSP